MDANGTRAFMVCLTMFGRMLRVQDALGKVAIGLFRYILFLHGSGTVRISKNTFPTINLAIARSQYATIDQTTPTSSSSGSFRCLWRGALSSSSSSSDRRSESWTGWNMGSKTWQRTIYLYNRSTFFMDRWGKLLPAREVVFRNAAKVWHGLTGIFDYDSSGSPWCWPPLLRTSHRHLHDGDVHGDAFCARGGDAPGQNVSIAPDLSRRQSIQSQLFAAVGCLSQPHTCSSM